MSQVAPCPGKAAKAADQMGTTHVFPEAGRVCLKYPKEPGLNIFFEGACECVCWHAGENAMLTVICRYDARGDVIREVPVRAVAPQVLEVAENRGGGADAFRINLGLHQFRDGGLASIRTNHDGTANGVFHFCLLQPDAHDLTSGTEHKVGKQGTMANLRAGLACRVDEHAVQHRAAGSTEITHAMLCLDAQAERFLSVMECSGSDLWRFFSHHRGKETPAVKLKNASAH